MRLRERGDLFAPVLKLKQTLPIESAPRAPRTRPARGRSQSGRHQFVKTKTELRLEAGGIFKIRDNVEDRGTYEIIEYDDARYDLWFSGAAMQGRWLLQKTGPSSWALTPTA